MYNVLFHRSKFHTQKKNREEWRINNNNYNSFIQQRKKHQANWNSWVLYSVKSRITPHRPLLEREKPSYMSRYVPYRVWIELYGSFVPFQLHKTHSEITIPKRTHTKQTFSTHKRFYRFDWLPLLFVQWNIYLNIILIRIYTVKINKITSSNSLHAMLKQLKQLKQCPICLHILVLPQHECVCNHFVLIFSPFLPLLSLSFFLPLSFSSTHSDLFGVYVCFDIGSQIAHPHTPIYVDECR